LLLLVHRKEGAIFVFVKREVKRQCCFTRSLYLYTAYAPSPAKARPKKMTHMKLQPTDDDQVVESLPAALGKQITHARSTVRVKIAHGIEIWLSGRDYIYIYRENWSTRRKGFRLFHHPKKGFQARSRTHRYRCHVLSCITCCWHRNCIRSFPMCSRKHNSCTCRIGPLCIHQYLQMASRRKMLRERNS
jgi:hypothetical protein